MAKEYEHRGRPLLYINQQTNCIEIRVATELGYQNLPLSNIKVGGVCDLSYPNSKLRRARIQSDGQISPALTCNGNALYVIEMNNE